MAVLPVAAARWSDRVPVLVLGGGACGLSAALAVRERGLRAVVLERTAEPQGSTSMSSGLIPAAGSALQRAAGIDDSVQRLIDDIAQRTGGTADPAVTRACAAAAGPVIDWLAGRWGVPLEFAPNWEALGHSRSRMHRVPGGAGDDLMRHLVAAARGAGVDIVGEAHVTALFVAPDGTLAGARAEMAGGGLRDVACTTMILATSGFGANSEMVREFLPEIAGAAYYGWDYNMGDAVRWGRALGAQLGDMDAYQGHPALADPQRISLHFEGIVAGGVQVNARGERFYDEADNPSSGGVHVLRQPGKFAFVVYGQDHYAEALTRKRTQIADDMGAIMHESTVAGLADRMGVPAAALEATLRETERLAAQGQPDRFGRRFPPGHRMRPPFHAIRVRGALFHTQGGLAVDGSARVLRSDGTPFANLFAGGGAARGISGAGARGYLPGNGLLTALCLGRIAGDTAAFQSAALEAR